MKIYLTHCSKEKSARARESGGSYPPDELYTDPELLAFIARCKESENNWAILSDRYGLFLPDEKHAYYEKPPSSVTLEEEMAITRDFHIRLAEYTEILFYVRRDTFHPFYERVLKNGPLAGRTTLFEDLKNIK